MPEVVKSKSLGEEIEELKRNSDAPEFVTLARNLIRKATWAEANRYAREFGLLQQLIALKTKFK